MKDFDEDANTFIDSQQLEKKEKQTYSITKENRQPSTDFQSEKEELSRNEAGRISLKETVLLRKLRNDRKSKNRWRIDFTSPSDDAKGFQDNSEEIRQQLTKNHEKLEHLLNHVPEAIRRSTSFDSCHATTKRNVQRNPQKTSPKQEDIGQLNRARQYENDENSSNEDLREPMADCQPNLSDENCAEWSSITKEDIRNDVTTSSDIGNNVTTSSEDDRRTSILLSSNPLFPGGTETRIFRTSLRSHTQMHQHEKNLSPTNPVYEAAKPRPLPRRMTDSHLNERLSMERNSLRVPLGEGERSQQPVMKLPYVSRSTFESQIKRHSLSSNFKLHIKDAAATTEENEALQTDSQINACHKAGMSEGLTSTTKYSSSPNRTALSSSSGYSSPGTLSLSTSNASSAASSHPLSLPSDRDHSDTVAAGDSSDLRETEEVAKEDVAADQITSNLNTNGDKDDVFPVSAWLESSEYTSLKQDTFRSEKARSINEDENKRLSTASDRTHYSSHSQLRERSTPQMRTKHQPKIRQRPKSDHISMNIVSMVEEPRMQQRKNSNKLLTGNVKVRLPIYNVHAQKTDASRQSRAFALQAKMLSEDSKKHLTLPNFLRTAPNSAAADFSKASGKTHYSKTDFSADKEFFQSLPRLGKVTSSEKLYNTISGATGRHLKEKSTFFREQHEQLRAFSNDTNYIDRRLSYAESSFDAGSTWTVNSEMSDGRVQSSPKRKLSFRNKLKGAFSFQNLRKAISMERLDTDQRQKSVSNSYLNEFNEDISQVSTSSSKTAPTTDFKSSDRVYKVPSINGLFNTVRMRKRRSRERRAARERNTIAVDPKQVPEYDFGSASRKTEQSKNDAIGKPAHFRPIGRVLQMDVRQGSLLVEMNKPPSSPFGFYLARNKESGCVFISSLSDSYPDKMYAGLMKLGDEITEINGTRVERLTLDQIYNIILENDRLVIRIKPSQVHVV